MSCGSDELHERTRLPKLTNTTVQGFLDSSQLTHRTALASSAVAASGMVGARTVADAGRKFRGVKKTT
jgi:hypothetical protein